jgi:hypothetical protein
MLRGGGRRRLIECCTFEVQYRRSKLVKLWIYSHKLGSQGISRNKPEKTPQIRHITYDFFFTSFFFHSLSPTTYTQSALLATLYVYSDVICSFIHPFISPLFRYSRSARVYCSFSLSLSLSTHALTLTQNGRGWTFFSSFACLILSFVSYRALFLITSLSPSNWPTY